MWVERGTATELGVVDMRRSHHVEYCIEGSDGIEILPGGQLNFELEHGPDSAISIPAVYDSGSIRCGAPVDPCHALESPDLFKGALILNSTFSFTPIDC